MPQAQVTFLLDTSKENLRYIFSDAAFAVSVVDVVVFVVVVVVAFVVALNEKYR